MLRIISLTLFLLFSSYNYASCYGSGVQFAPAINVDLSDKLSDKTPVWEGSFHTAYSGSFNCSTSSTTFGYQNLLDNDHPVIMGFNNGKYWVHAEIINPEEERVLSGKGEHNASELNVPFNIRFSLVSKGGNQHSSDGDIYRLEDVMLVSDKTGVGWGAWIYKWFQWLTNGFHWPYDNKDMYGQPMIIKYEPKMTTCSFDNAGLAVKLPTLGLSQITQDTQNGLTPFTLNFSCQNRQSNGTADRDINMFLSSNNLLQSDNTVLIDKSNGAARGVGIRLVKMTSPNSPVSLSFSNIEQGAATSLLHVTVGNALDEKFSIGMAAYYYPYNTTDMSSGMVNTSATLNISYK